MTETQLHEKPHYLVPLTNWALFIVPLLYAAWLGISCRAFNSFADLLRVSFSIPAIAYYVLVSGATFIISYSTTNTMCAFDGSQESYTKCLRWYHIQCIFNCLTPMPVTGTAKSPEPPSEQNVHP